MKLMFSHGGLLTLQESIWHMKPVLGLPISTETRKNIQRAVDLGFAEAIDVNNFTSLEIIVKIRMLLENPIYLNNVENVGKLMRSAPMKPLETALYWIEKVVENRGLDHLKSEARKLSFFQLYMLDVTSIVGITILIYILIIQYHFVKNRVLEKERQQRRKDDDETAKRDENGADKLKSE